MYSGSPTIPASPRTMLLRAKQIENQVEHLYRQALAELFHQPEDSEHIVEMLKLRETYRHLSNAADAVTVPPTSCPIS